MKLNLIEKTITMSSAYSAADTNVIDAGFSGGDSFSATISATVDTPGAKTFLAAAVTVDPVNTLTVTAHGYTAGLKLQISNPGTLPVGLSAITDYFVIVVNANTIQLATTLANALAGTAVVITGIGVGTNTLTPTSIAGGSVKLQQSNDNSNWTDLGSATNITATGVVYLEKDRPTSRYIRLYLTLTAGHISLSSAILVKGDKS